MDRHLILPTLAVLATVLLFWKVIPLIEHSIPAETYQAGDIQTVHDMIAFSPAEGWMPDGVPAPSAPELRIFRDGVTLLLAPGSWNGTTDELMDEILTVHPDYFITGERRAFSLPSGMEGVGVGIGNDGAVMALASPTTAAGIGNRTLGVRVEIHGPSGLVPEYGADIRAMLGSIRPIVESEAMSQPAEPEE